MHPAIARFVEQFEEEALSSGSYRNKLGKYEMLFLENVFGPVFQFQFAGLKAEYPIRDFKGGDRFIDFVYLRNGIRLMIEIDGYTTHARNISPGDFDDHLMRQNDMILAGWMVLRFSASQVEKKSYICRRQLVQALGHWWTIVNQDAAASMDSMEIRWRRLCSWL